MSDMDAMKTLVRRAIKFSDWAAGEGLCPAGYDDTDQEERNPEDFFFAYSTATGDEDWNGLSDRVFARIAALEETLSSIALDCQGASVCGEPEMGLETIYHKATAALEAKP